MELVAVIKPEVIETADGLQEVVVVDFYEKGPERRADWIAHILAVEVAVPKRATDAEITEAVNAQTVAFEQQATTPAPQADDTRTRRTLDSRLVGRDLEPPR